MYDSGRGVAKDEAEAVESYRKAADQGLARALATRALASIHTQLRNALGLTIPQALQLCANEVIQ
jgi:TPR repeat protein